MANITKGGFYLKSSEGKTLQVAPKYIEMVTKLKSDNFVVFDTETTALSPDVNYGKIIEIGAVKIQNGKIVDRFSTFINPGMRIPRKIVELTHITDEMVAGAPDIFTAVRSFNQWIGKEVLVAHNARFDMSFLEFWLGKVGEFYEGDSHICTMILDKIIAPDAVNHKLATAISRYGIVNESAHRAVDDAEATAKLLLEMKKEFLPFLNNLNYNYFSSKKEVLVDDLKIKSCGDWCKPATKTNSELNRLYVNLYYPKEQIYGTIYYDRIKKCWFNKDFPDGYVLDFDAIESLVKILRKGAL